MPETLSKEEVVRLGKERYERDIRAAVEGENRGKFLVMDVLTGGYVISDDDNVAFKRARADFPDGVLYILRIGHSAAYRIGQVTRKAD